MSNHEQDQSSDTRMARREESRSIANMMMDTVGGATRLGMNLANLPLGLLPNQSRDHMRNAIRELSYAFAQLPRDFATIAEKPIEEWIARADQPAATPPAATAAHTAAPPVAAAHTAAPPVAATSLATPATPTASPPTEPAPTPAEPRTPPPAAEQPQERNRGPEAHVDKSTTGNIEIAFIEYNPIGSDLQGEYVVLRNTSTEAIAMKGWRLVDDAGNTFVFPNFSLAPAGEVRIWTKKGRNSRNALYWGRSTAAWNNTGDTARLLDTDGNEVARYQYTVPRNTHHC
jgi:hypothetical protein